MYDLHTVKHGSSAIRFPPFPWVDLFTLLNPESLRPPAKNQTKETKGRKSNGKRVHAKENESNEEYEVGRALPVSLEEEPTLIDAPEPESQPQS